MLLGACLFLFQNCGSQKAAQQNSASVTNVVFEPVENVLSPLFVEEVEELYNGGDFATNSAPTQYNSLTSTPHVVTGNRDFSGTHTFDNSVLINHSASVEFLNNNGENYSLQAVSCVRGDFFSNNTLNLTNNMTMNVGSCPYDINRVLGTDQYVKISGSMEILGDLHVNGLLLITENAIVKIHGRIIFGSGPLSPGVIINAGGTLEGDNTNSLVLGNPSSNGTFFLH